MIRWCKIWRELMKIKKKMWRDMTRVSKWLKADMQIHHKCNRCEQSTIGDIFNIYNVNAANYTQGKAK